MLGGCLVGKEGYFPFYFLLRRGGPHKGYLEVGLFLTLLDFDLSLACRPVQHEILSDISLYYRPTS